MSLGMLRPNVDRRGMSRDGPRGDRRSCGSDNTSCRQAHRVSTLSGCVSESHAAWLAVESAESEAGNMTSSEVKVRVPLRAAFCGRLCRRDTHTGRVTAVRYMHAVYIQQTGRRGEARAARIRFPGRKVCVALWLTACAPPTHSYTALRYKTSTLSFLGLQLPRSTNSGCSNRVPPDSLLIRSTRLRSLSRPLLCSKPCREPDTGAICF